MAEPQTKTIRTSIMLTPDAKSLLVLLSGHLGISQSAVFEFLIREKARRERIVLPTEQGEEPTNVRERLIVDSRGN